MTVPSVGPNLFLVDGQMDSRHDS